MIIKEIRINNFRSYYGMNIFTFSKDLTLIIGGNGDGKTTFFEALEWLFNTSVDDRKESNISEKSKAEIEIGELKEVSVSIKFEHDGEKELEKRFKYERINNNSIATKGFEFVGYENIGSERLLRDGKDLLERCFDTFIRKYCLFKGESNLNVFDNSTALKVLVDKFSGIKQFEDLVELTKKFEEKSETAFNKELGSDKKVSRKAKELNFQLSHVRTKIQEIKRDITIQKKAVDDYSNRLESLERHQDTSERYQDLKKRINSLREKQSKLRAFTNLDYNAYLLDNYWILRSFPKVLNEFQKKTSTISREKRKLEKSETERRAKQAGAQEALEKIQKLANGATPLPWNLPDKETMQEMIDEEVCKVCGREALKGSKEHDFMINKLNEYLMHINLESKQESKQEESKPYFPNSYINELHTRQIRMGGEVEKEITNIETDISDRLAFINARSKDLEKLNKEIQEAEDEKNRLLIQVPDITEDMLNKNFNDFKGFIETKGRAEKRIIELEYKLSVSEKEKEEIDNDFKALKPANTMTQVYQRVHTAFQRIMKAFINAKEKNVEEFLRMLEKEANGYLKRLNENDFYGIVRIIPTADGSAGICLYSKNGSLINDPGGAQKTTMYMSVLFAISKITTLKREQDYPLIFDAPTSSFEDYKEEVFYNVIDKIEKQCIIITKDLLITDEKTGLKKLDEEKIRELTCSVYRIKKAPDFNPLDLSTIHTIVTQIK